VDLKPSLFAIKKQTCQAFIKKLLAERFRNRIASAQRERKLLLAAIFSTVLTSGPDHPYGAEDRGPSEISRELRSPVTYDQNHCV
jgi:hypothetical protein